MKFNQVIEKQVATWSREIESMDLESLARDRAGFQIRTQRKIALHHFVSGILAVAAAGALSCERLAGAIANKSRQRYSKQAFHERLGNPLITFLLAVFCRCFLPSCRESSTRGLLAPFHRVLIQDSSTLPLPDRLAKAFPGSSNQRKGFAMAKIQVVCDLLNSRVAQLSISGFTRNDQAASADILDILQPGDLVIRDLGYFALHVLQKISLAGAFFLSRFRHGVTLLDPATLKPIPLLKHLRKHGSFDALVLLGQSERVPVRLVALPVPSSVANSRRRQLRKNRDKRLNPSKEHFALLGWNIFVTNVPCALWPTRHIPSLYRLRWRIETLFKAWKSSLRLRELSTQTPDMLELHLVTKLIFCAFAYRTCMHIELVDHQDRPASILRVCRILSSVAIYYEAAILGLRIPQLLALLIERHAFYESRSDRSSFPSVLQSIFNAAQRKRSSSCLALT